MPRTEPFKMALGDVLDPGQKVWVLGTYLGTHDNGLAVRMGYPGVVIRVVPDEVKPTVSKEGGL